MKKREILVFITIIFIIFTIANTFYIIDRTNKAVSQKISGKSTGFVRLCINNQPEINVSMCERTAYTDMLYYCNVSGTDDDTAFGQNLSFSSQFIEGKELFEISPTGIISYIPVDGDEGDYAIKVTVADNSECYNDEDEATFSLTVKRSACINHTPPIINLSVCSQVAYQNSTYTCQVEGHSDYLMMYDLSFSSEIISQNLYFSSGVNRNDSLINITRDGIINFTANNSDVGYYSINITLDDGTGCPNSTDSGVLNITIYNINDPPSFHGPIPNQTWEQDTTLVPFDLDDYFEDIDLDPLTYTHSLPNNIDVEIDEYNRVKFTPIPGWYGQEYITFFAADPSKTSARSNQILLTVLPEEQILTTKPGGSSGGAGGFSKCIPEWYCEEWEPCLPEGYQTRKCIDLNDCGTLLHRPNTTQACVYISTCYDGIQNNGEEGVDCGGLCPPCPTCYDGIQNQNETGIDCGGPCDPCPGCANRIKDEFEEGVDCGGPCPPCPTCNDKIKNCHYVLQEDGSYTRECETGVDCGGLCPPCLEVEVPGYFEDKNRLLTLVMIISVVAISIFLITYKFTHEFFKKLLAKLGIYIASRKRRKEEAQLLSLSFADKIIEKLNKLEKQLSTKKETRYISSEFSKIVREYFREILNLKYEFTYEELLNELKKKGLDSEMESMLVSFFKKAIEVEYSKYRLRRRELHSLIDEAKEIVHLTSRHEPKENLKLENIPKDKLEIDKLYIVISNIQKLLEFNKVEAATKLYTNALDAYNDLSEKDKDQIYPHLKRLYKEIKIAAMRR
jgi:hypothetical protein